MISTAGKKCRALAFGDLWEIKHIFALDLFRTTYPVEAIHVEDFDEFREAIENSEFDLILIDVEPHSLDMLDIVFNNPPLPPVIMVADAQYADVIIEAKKRGLERYVIRLDESETNIALLCEEIRSVVEHLVQPRSTGEPMNLGLHRKAEVKFKERQEAEQRAEQSMRMDAIGELAGGVAHDFNNILAVITAIGYVLKARLHQLGEAELITYIDRIQQAVESGTSLTEQLLSFSSKKKIAHELTDLGRHLNDVSQLLERAVGDEIQLRLMLDADATPITVGKGHLDQITMNLAVNARDAMPEGGTVTIYTCRVHIDPDETSPHEDLEPGDWVVLEFADDGIGMDRETRRRIFDPFYTTKSPGKGTGMGLANVYQIVDRSGGKIYVNSQPGAGTTFTIYFPAARDSEVARAGIDTYATKVSMHTGGCILLVEDEDDIREPYCIFLENAGYEVVDAPDVEQARAGIKERGDNIDILLADVILPDGSGVDLAKELQARNADVELIFMSGYAPDLIYRDEEELENEWHFLPKPVSRDTLLAAVSAALQRRRSRSKQRPSI